MSTQSSRAAATIFKLTAPAYLWLALTVFLPLSAMFLFSFMVETPIGDRPIEGTLKHYRAFFEKDFYRTLTWRSLRMGIDVTAICFLIGFPAALVLAKTIRGRWREALFLLVILPFWSNALVRIFSWTMVFRGKGVIDSAVHLIWPDAAPISLMFTYPAIIVGLVHSYLPYMILTCYLSLQAVDDSLIEAARSLGAGWLTITRRILLPLATPGIAAGVVLTFVPVVGSFMEPRILGGRNGTMLGTIIEDQFTTVFNWPLGAALSYIMLACVLVLLALLYPLLRTRLT